jgi:hypothetical protein
LAAITLRSFGLYFLALLRSGLKTLVLASALLIGLVAGTRGERRIHTKFTPILILIVGIGLVLSCFPPAAYGMSGGPPPRTLIIPTYILVLTIVVFGYSLSNTMGRAFRLARVAQVLAVLLTLAVGIASGDRLMASRPTYAAYAAGWDRSRAEILAASKAGDKRVAISTLQMDQNSWSGNAPIMARSGFWVNKCVAQYYGLRRIRSTSPPP